MFADGREDLLPRRPLDFPAFGRRLGSEFGFRPFSYARLPWSAHRYWRGPVTGGDILDALHVLLVAVWSWHIDAWWVKASDVEQIRDKLGTAAMWLARPDQVWNTEAKRST